MASALEGVADLTGQLTELGAKAGGRELVAVVKEVMQIAEHAARARLPQGEEPHKTYKGRIVSGGFALSTLHVEARLNKRTGSAVALLGVGREAFYAAIFVELGTSKTPAQPWLRPAFAESEEPMLRQISVTMQKRIAKIVKRRERAARRST